MILPSSQSHCCSYFGKAIWGSSQFGLEGCFDHLYLSRCTTYVCWLLITGFPNVQRFCLACSRCSLKEKTLTNCCIIHIDAMTVIWLASYWSWCSLSDSWRSLSCMQWASYSPCRAQIKQFTSMQAPCWAPCSAPIESHAEPMKCPGWVHAGFLSGQDGAPLLSDTKGACEPTWKSLFLFKTELRLALILHITTLANFVLSVYTWVL